MKKIIVFVFCVFTLFDAHIVSANDQPITQAEVEAITREGMSADVMGDFAKTEAYTIKYSVPHLRMHMINEATVPGMPPQVQDVTYNSLSELLGASKEGVPADGKVFAEPPKIKLEVSGFRYDASTKQAEINYRANINGISPMMPNFTLAIEQSCRMLYERQVDQTIKATVGSCRQKMTATPMAEM